MAEIRTLKLNLLADVDQFGRGIGQAKGEMSGFDKTVSKISKRATAAFAAVAASAGYMAITIGKESVQAFIDDEASAERFRQTLVNTTGATDDLIGQTEDWIKKAQLATGFADDKLRNAFGNLARATNDVEDSQKLLNLAMDISRATGKDLETVSLTLAKAYDGNYGSLQKLGVQVDDTKKKTNDFWGIVSDLSATFKDQASVYAETYAGKLDILSQKSNELKESIGGLLIPQVQKFVDYANKTLLPALEQMAAGFAGDPNSAESAAYNLGSSVRELSDAFGALFASLTSGKSSDASSNIQALADALSNVAKAINAIASAFDYLNRVWDKIPDKLKPLATLSTGAFQKFAGIRAAGGSVMGGQAYRVGEFGPEMFVPSGSGSIRPAGASGNVTININGIVDAESARRSIEKLLQDSARRTGAVSLVGATL